MNGSTASVSGQHVAFLRGINVGGRRVTSDQLITSVASLGFSNVRTFLASGNVIFSTSASDALETHIEAALRTRLGFEVDAFVRTASEVAGIAQFEPFSAEVMAGTAGKLQVTFLRAEPNSDAVTQAMACASEQDRLAIVGREWYWLPTEGISTSRLDFPRVERVLGRGTTRTANTVQRLLARL